MLDEEMAEVIANKRCHEIMCYGHCSFNSPKHHRCGEWHREYNCALEGLKAGRPQWNYMKDVNCYEDLPHNEDVYYAYVVNVGAYDKPTIERKLGSFAEFEFDVMAYHVIAWCEIPTFDKESETHPF